jgi:tRNA modification GTPase
VAVNKSDLQQRLDLCEARQIFTGSCFVHVCAQDGTGIDGLKSKLRQFLLGRSIESPVILNNLRHKNSLLRGQDVLRTAIEHLKRGDPPEIVAVSLQEAKETLEEVVGIVTSDELLERVFSNFCIGK